MKDVLSPEALQDFEGIFVYIALNENLETAEHVKDKILEEIRNIARSPEIGHRRSDLTNKDILFRSVFKYLILYWPETSPLEIARIIHGAQDVKTMMEE